MTNSDEKVCPRCAETIKAAAKVCRFCNHEFGEPSVAPTAPMKPPAAEPEGKPSSKGCAKIIGGFVGVVLLLMFIGSMLDSSKTSSTSSGADSTSNECSSNWKVCTDNADLVNHWSDWTKVQAACQIAAEHAAKYGTPKWPWIPFGSYLKGNDYISGGIATAIEDDAQFQNGFGVMVHSEVRCRYDLDSQIAVDVSIQPR